MRRTDDFLIQTSHDLDMMTKLRALELIFPLSIADFQCGFGLLVLMKDRQNPAQFQTILYKGWDLVQNCALTNLRYFPGATT